MRKSTVETNEKILHLYGGLDGVETILAGKSQKQKEEMFRFSLALDHNMLEGGDISHLDSTGQGRLELYLLNSVEAILKRNTFGENLYDGISRLNHACSPNAQQLTTHNPYLGHVQAILPIEMDEEVTISYIVSNTLTEVERKAQIRSWGFTCTCDWCGVEKEARARDENQRVSLYLAQEKGASEDNAVELRHFAEQNIKIMEERGQRGRDYFHQYVYQHTESNTD